MTTKTEFPCGCVCERDCTVGEAVLVTTTCEPHQQEHEGGVTIDDASFVGCDCPGCEFGRYAVARNATTGNLWPDNWKFLARLNARRRRSAG